MELNKRYFIVSIKFSLHYEFAMREEPDGTFIDTATSEKYRKRLLYNWGWGEEDGYEMLPPLTFPDLIYLIECFSPQTPARKKFFGKHKSSMKEEDRIKFYNLIGAVSVIMQDHVEELIDFFAEKIGTDYFENPTMKENFRWFSVDTEKTRELGKIPGGILTQSYGDILNQYAKWREISSRVIEQIYG